MSVPKLVYYALVSPRPAKADPTFVSRASGRAWDLKMPRGFSFGEGGFFEWRHEPQVSNVGQANLSSAEVRGPSQVSSSSGRCASQEMDWELTTPSHHAK